MHANEASADVFINDWRGKWAEFFATFEPFDLSDELADVRSNDAPRPVTIIWKDA